MNEFKIVNFLRNGEKYLLLKVKSKVDGFYYLLKHINFQILNEEEKENAFNESKILFILKHPNIIELKEIFFNKSKNLNLVMDFPSNDNLKDKIQYSIQNKRYFEENTIWEVLTQILIGLNYLHEKGIIHRNLQSRNIFISQDELIKITDFNCCYMHNKKMSLYQPLITISSYTAPELLNKQKFSYKCDIWSVGCIIYEMAALTLPFKSNNEISYNNINNSKDFESFPSFYSNNLKSIINDMLSIDQSKRPSTDVLLNFSNIKETAKKLNPIYTLNKNNREQKNKSNQNKIVEQIFLKNEKKKYTKAINENKNESELNAENDLKNNFKIHQLNIIQKTDISVKLNKIVYNANENKPLFKKVTNINKKSINNARYKALKERKFGCLQRNNLKQKEQRHLSRNDNGLNTYKIKNKKDNNQNYYLINSFSTANADINKLYDGSFLKSKLINNNSVEKAEVSNLPWKIRLNKNLNRTVKNLENLSLYKKNFKKNIILKLYYEMHIIHLLMIMKK